MRKKDIGDPYFALYVLLNIILLQNQTCVYPKRKSKCSSNALKFYLTSPPVLTLAGDEVSQVRSWAGSRPALPPPPPLLGPPRSHFISKARLRKAAAAAPTRVPREHRQQPPRDVTESETVISHTLCGLTRLHMGFGRRSRPAQQHYLN